jgi:hypothetical protein
MDPLWILTLCSAVAGGIFVPVSMAKNDPRQKQATYFIGNSMLGMIAGVVAVEGVLWVLMPFSR